MRKTIYYGLKKNYPLFKKWHQFTCILLVNDGSSDKSLFLIKDVCFRNPDFLYISFYKNKGLSAALKAGIDVAESTYIGYIDADLQTSPEDFNLLFPYINDYEMVIGIRVGRKDGLLKKHLQE